MPFFQVQKKGGEKVPQIEKTLKKEVHGPVAVKSPTPTMKKNPEDLY